MNFSYLWDARPPIPLHALLALAALVLGALQLLQRKGTRAHRQLGYVWVALMAGTAISGLFIHELRIWGLFSPIHLLIVLTLLGLFGGIRAIRRGDVRRHRLIMQQLFWMALVITGLFTFMPGRVMHLGLFGPPV